MVFYSRVCLATESDVYQNKSSVVRTDKIRYHSLAAQFNLTASLFYHAFDHRPVRQ